MSIGKSRIISVVSDTEPVTLAEAKNYLRVTVDTTDDALITSQITAARQIAEGYLSRDILPREREQFIYEINDLQTTRDGYVLIDLYYAPIDTVTSVEDENGTLTENDSYEVIGLENDPFIQFYNNSHKELKITYETEGLQTDNRVKQGVLAILADLYNGEDIKKSCFAILASLKKKYI